MIAVALLAVGAISAYLIVRYAPHEVPDDSTWLDDQPAEIQAALAAEDFRLWTEELTP